MAAPQIIRVPILPFGLVNSHLVTGSRGCVLVDAGLPESESKIEKTLTKHGFSFKDIKLIVVTHAHVDHAGSAHALRELSGAPIVAHADDAKHFSRDTPMTFCPTGWFGRLFLKTQLMYEPYKGFVPDILLSGDDTIDISRYGIPGTIKHTPGHTAGSISVEMFAKEALVGDLIASGILLGGIVRTDHAKRPPFEDNPQAIGLALQLLLDSGVEKFYMGHGGPLTAGEVQRHVQVLMEMKQDAWLAETNS
jgi:hydroxyacylglutathione hydrolase